MLKNEYSAFVGLALLIWDSLSRNLCLILSSGVVAANETSVTKSRFAGVSPVDCQNKRIKKNGKKSSEKKTVSIIIKSKQYRIET